MGKDIYSRPDDRGPQQSSCNLQEMRAPTESRCSSVNGKDAPLYMQTTPEQEAQLKLQDEAIARGEIPIGVSLTPEQEASYEEALANGTLVGWVDPV